MNGRTWTETPEKNRDIYAGLTGFTTEHSGLLPESRPLPGPLRLQNDPEDFVAYDLPIENLSGPRPRRSGIPNILRRSRPAARPNVHVQLRSHEYSQNENVGRIVRIQDGERMISSDEWTRRYPRSSSQGQSSRQHARSVSHSNRQRDGRHQSRNLQRYNIAQRPPTLMDLYLSPPRPSPSSPLFFRPPVEPLSPARGSSGVSPSNPPRNETQSGSHEPTRESEPVPDRPLLDTSSVRTVFRDFGPDPPEDPEERELWNLEQRLMEQRYGTPSKVSPPPEQRILDRSGTPQYSTPRSGPAASREGWTTGSGPISLNNSPAVHFEPVPDFEDDDEESQEETREARAPAVNGYVRNNSTLAQLRLSTAQNVRERPFVEVAPSDRFQKAPSFTDNLISDFSAETFQNVLGKLNTEGIKSGIFPREGRIIGSNRRLILPLFIQFRKKTIIAPFLVDTGAPLTWISPKTFEAFMGAGCVTESQYQVSIEGLPFESFGVSPNGTVAQDINLLGMDLLEKLDVSIKIKYSLAIFTLYRDI